MSDTIFIKKDDTKEREFCQWVWDQTFPHPFERFTRCAQYNNDEAWCIEVNAVRDCVILKNIHILTDKRKGVGTKVMNWLLQKADEMGIVLKLDAVPFTKELKKSDLVRFYKKFGFVKDNGSVGDFKFELVRYPKNANN